MKVFVGIPTMTGVMPIDIIQGLHDAMASTGHSLVLHYERGSSPVDLARNKICFEFLKSKCDVLWMIDDDTLPPHNIGDVLDVESDIVSPIVVGAQTLPSGKIGLFNVAFMQNPGGDWRTMDWEIRNSGVIDVDALGTGCILIHRRVLEDSRMRLSPSYVDLFGEKKELGEDETPAIFEIKRKPNGEWICGEDLTFCARAKQLGYSIKLHTGVVCGHLKNIDLKSILLDNVKTEANTCRGSNS